MASPRTGLLSSRFRGYYPMVERHGRGSRSDASDSLSLVLSRSNVLESFSVEDGEARRTQWSEALVGDSLSDIAVPGSHSGTVTILQGRCTGPMQSARS